MMVNESDATVAKGRLSEAILLVEYVEKINGVKMDTRKIEALWLMTRKSTARALDFDTMVVKPGVVAPMTDVLHEKRWIGEKLSEGSCQRPGADCESDRRNPQVKAVPLLSQERRRSLRRKEPRRT